ncbi:MAG: biosynthetic-type acetolactate synthase large subunit [Nitrospira sp.]|nr:biosynthetic-type acetolactate synthase large subunit [Candidatus Manganitrophaceae bacterium]HIL34880.1 biosynthetic-type acetolactate synthase large subunit [Candidatus Manganitrophaceae bacterium]
MKLSGSQILIECLRKENVKVVFAYPGGVNLPIFDVLYDEKEIEVILCRHEQGGTHMAEGYARVTGRPGVVLVTSGPGATNTVTAIADAYMDSTPLVVLTGQVPTQSIGNDAFQEADVVGITRPCTKYNILVKDVNDLAKAVKEAFYIATSGRPGPVLVDLPKDVVLAKTEFKYPDKVYIRSYSPNYKGNKWQIKQAAESIMKARRPVIYAGGGVLASGASQELLDLAEGMQVPVTQTLMGLGGFPGTHPLSLGMLGMHGTYWANMSIHHSDLIIAVGSRFDDRVTGRVADFAPGAKIIHIDIDPTSIHKVIKADIPIVGDVKVILSGLNQILKFSENGQSGKNQAWLSQISDWRKEHPLAYDQGDKIIKPQYVIERIYEATRGKAIVSTDVGQHQMWVAQYYKFDRPRTFPNSGGLGTMGYGLPAAIGAQKAFPDDLVFCVAGDGSIVMNIQEMATAVSYNLPVKIAVINNKYLGMVRQWQELFYDRRYSSSYLGDGPDFVKLAEAFGAVGLRAKEIGEVDQVLQEALAVKGPVMMDFQVDEEENCYPMVPAGAAIHEMVFSDPEEAEPKKQGEKEQKKADGVLTA